MKKPNYVLDSYAVLAFLQAEAHGQGVKDLLVQANRATALVHLSLISLGEILYIIGRKLGDDTAEQILQDIKRLPLELAGVTLNRVLDAAHVKAHYAISYADAFVVALGRELAATVVTGDPEFRKVETLVDLLWLS